MINELYSGLLATETARGLRGHLTRTEALREVVAVGATVKPVRMMEAMVNTFSNETEEGARASSRGEGEGGGGTK